MNTAISVILPNYNGRHLLEKNIPSLISALNGFHFEIIIVDDCSSDGSIKFLIETYPDIEIIQSSTNEGFSSTCNKGINAAKYELLCIANTDVIFANDYFLYAIPHFEVPNIFAVAGNINNYASSIETLTNTDKTSLMYFSRGLLRFNQRVEPNPEIFTGQINGQFILLGCCFLCNKDKLLQLGGFDEIFSPFYWEDADLAIRALRRGYKLVYEPKCNVFHKTSSTIGEHTKNYTRRLISNRNKLIFTWRHLTGLKNWLLHIFFSSFNIITRWLILDWKYYVSLAMALGRTLKFFYTRK